MRAVNLLPGDYKRAKGAGTGSLRGPGSAIVGLLALAVGLVTIYVVTTNSVTDQKSKLASLQRQVPAVQAMSAELTPYTAFAGLAQQRAQTVSTIASGRFDWAASMDDLAKVVPANTSLQSLSATAGTGTTAGAATAASPATTGGSGVRGALPNPAFELRGCTGSQDDVARLMSRLRLMNGVLRVTLGNATKQAAATAGSTGAPAPSSGAAGSAAGSCPTNGSSFDLVVFFNGAQPAGGSTASASASGPPSPTAAAQSAVAASGSHP
jgi:Tfp pilus assembly protein PilN